MDFADTGVEQVDLLADLTTANLNAGSGILEPANVLDMRPYSSYYVIAHADAPAAQGFRNCVISLNWLPDSDFASTQIYLDPYAFWCQQAQSVAGAVKYLQTGGGTLCIQDACHGPYLDPFMYNFLGPAGAINASLQVFGSTRPIGIPYTNEYSQVIADVGDNRILVDETNTIAATPGETWIAANNGSGRCVLTIENTGAGNITVTMDYASSSDTPANVFTIGAGSRSVFEIVIPKGSCRFRIQNAAATPTTFRMFLIREGHPI